MSVDIPPVEELVSKCLGDVITRRSLVVHLGAVAVLARSPADDGLSPPGSWATVVYGDRRWPMRLPPEDHIGGVLCTGTPYELELLERTSALLPAGAVVVDVGANIGNHAVFWALVAGAHVVALEPNPEAVGYLRANVSANGLDDRVDVVTVAAGARPGGAAVVDRAPATSGRRASAMAVAPSR